MRIKKRKHAGRLYIVHDVEIDELASNFRVKLKNVGKSSKSIQFSKELNETHEFCLW